MLEHIARGAIGIFVLLGVVIIFSDNRKKIDWRLVIVGICLQMLICILLNQVNFIRVGFGYVSDGFVQVTQFTKAGSEFVFGGLVGDVSSYGFIFAFQVLPTIIFFSALTSLLYYLGVLQVVVKAFAWVMARTMRLSGSESIAAAANVFLGQTEAPLLVKPYVASMTRSELMCLMTGGMATIAGSVLAAYIGILGGDDPVAQQKFAGHLLTASLMNAPAAIVMAKILRPENNPEAINTDLSVSKEKIGGNLIDAISNGTSEGLKLALNVGAMLIAFIALIYGVNFIFGKIGGISWGDVDAPDQINSINEWVTHVTDGKFTSLSLQLIVGAVFSLFAWAIGIEWADCLAVGSLLGTKVIVNEFVAYSDMGTMKGTILSDRSVMITTFALSGFANFSSIGIQIGGIGGIAPNQKEQISKLGLLAVLGGTMATMMSGTVAGMYVETDFNWWQLTIALTLILGIAALAMFWDKIRPKKGGASTA